MILIKEVLLEKLKISKDTTTQILMSSIKK